MALSDLAVDAVHAQASTSRAAARQDYRVVATAPELTRMLDELKSSTCIAVDCEGVKLGERQGGKLTLLQLSARIPASSKTPRIWVVDVVALQAATFTQQSSDGSVSLKQLLEDERVLKLMFDVRSDAFQLQQEHGIRLRAPYDLQLAEVAARQVQMLTTAYVMPLDKALATYLDPRPSTLEEDILASYEISRAYHYSNKTEVWAERPLSAELLNYAAVDVRYLHALADALNMKLPGLVVEKVKQASLSRASATEGPNRQRAGAPMIVSRSDVYRMLNSRSPATRPTQPLQGPPHTSQPQSDSAAHTDNGSEAQTGVRAKRRRPRAPKPAPSEPVSRDAPRLLSVQDMLARQSAAQGGAPVSQSESVSGLSLLQPRQRQEGEEAPSWIYDSLKHRDPEEGSNGHSEVDNGSEHVTEDTQGSLDGGSDGAQGGEDGVVQDSVPQPDVGERMVEAGLLLFRPDKPVQSQQPGPQLARPPTLIRPPSRS